MQIYGKMMPHSEPLAKAMNKQKLFALWAVCIVQKNFCLIVGLASQEETGSETGKIETKFARLNVKHCTIATSSICKLVG